LGQASAPASFGELSSQLAPLERGRDPQRDRSVVCGELIDQLVKVILAGHHPSLRQPL
jgi:hypothetical protein